MNQENQKLHKTSKKMEKPVLNNKYIAPGLLKNWIKRLKQKRATMSANGSNCADIDAQLENLSKYNK
ncbi:hypothetical protein [Nitrosomonas ureae]|uniref:Uncharacterized protein n=1 Tax=Nitrosomonas ureae TaxID=44577 RepID=A0A1H2END7_9PROT|nr:hypothetical protein [Nitrosomonas ureae]ALQ51924.1 hypothetical protein ATY38_12250 [Nitrosomonas ureae]SDT96529.1 hypothetical protein SAMN05216406_11418 [Nitrosomonas ureae]